MTQIRNNILFGINEVIHHGKHYFVHHTPWFDEPGGELSGLIELDIEIPDTHPIFNRDKE